MHTPSVFHLRRCALVCAAAFLSAGAPACAAFTLFSDFEAGYVLGPLHGQTGWSVQGNDPNSAVVSDPTDPFNQVGSFVNGPGSTNIARTLPGGGLLNGTVGTLFFRLHAPAAVNFNIGASDIPIGSLSADFTNFESQIRLGNSAANAMEVDVRSGGGFTTGTGSNTTTYTPDSWFNVWLVINNATDTTQFYVSDAAGGNAGAPFAQGSFRNGVAANSLVTFYARTSSVNPVFVDDIYFDPAGANLANPIPEPCSAALVALGFGLMINRRRLGR